MVGLPPLPAPHTRIGVGGVLIRDGRVLVNRAAYRQLFTIPSGYVEPGESLQDALERELEEETGVRATAGPLLLSRHKVVDIHESDVYFAFRLDYVEGRPEPKLPEIAEIREPTVLEAVESEWISEFSRLAIRVGASSVGWPRSAWAGGASPGLSYEAFHPLEREP